MSDSRFPLVSVSDAVKKYFTDRQASRNWERTPGKYYASQSFSCPARVYFQAKNIGEEQEPPYGIFERGVYAEDFLIKALQSQYGERLMTQVPVKIQLAEGFQVTGKIDAMLVDYNLKPIRIWEIKSMVGKTAARKEAKKGHKGQALIYNAVLGPLEGTSVVYINTGDYLDITEHVISGTFDEDWEELVQYWVMTHDSIVHDMPMQRPYSDYECHYFRQTDKTLMLCPFYQTCKGYGSGPANPVRPSLAKYMPEGMEP